jgi:hypothetical protein
MCFNTIGRINHILIVETDTAGTDAEDKLENCKSLYPRKARLECLW